MFAIAAFALSGMAITPAFADSKNTYNNLTPGVNGQENVKTVSVSCSGMGNEFITKVTPYTNFGDGYVKVVTNGSACNGFDDVVIDVKINGTWCSGYTTSSAIKTTYFHSCDFVAGDTVTVLSVYSW